MDSEAILLELRHIFPSWWKEVVMEQDFDAVKFVQQMKQGDFDGHLQAELCNGKRM